MITDEEIDAIVEQHKRGHDEVYYRDFARAIYQLGRQQQRESDAALCESMHGARNGDCAVSVLCNNTGDK